MRKGFTPAFSQPIHLLIGSLFAALGLLSASADAQVTGKSTYRDGFPKFQRLDATKTTNVDTSDSVVTLVPRQTSFTDPATYVLSGVDWIYANNSSSSPVIRTAQDIDKISGENRYFITDSLTRRIYIIRIQGASQVKTDEIGFDTPPSGDPRDDIVLDKPEDTYFYRSAGDSREKIVITDKGRNRVLQVDIQNKQVDWDYGGTLGSGSNQLSSPSDATVVDNTGQQALICDTGNRRVILINTATKQVVSTFTTLSSTAGSIILKSPIDIEVDPTSSENFLVTDQEDHRVMLVNRSTGQVVWSFGTGQAGADDNTLNSPTDADIIPNASGNILICDFGNKRVIEVERSSLQIVYRFPNAAQRNKVLRDLQDADRITVDGPDVDKTFVVAGDPNDSSAGRSVLPFRLAYFNENFTSGEYEFPEAVSVDFDNLSFPTPAADVPSGTRIRVQMRSSAIRADLATAVWRGPTSDTDFYTGPVTAINPRHDGHRFFQFRVFLDNNINAQNTSDPRLTPVLRSLKVTGHYYEANKPGILTSNVIRDAQGRTITKWLRLIANQVLPADTPQRDQIFIDVRLLDEQGNVVLHDVNFLSKTKDSNEFDLTTVNALRGVQGLRLQAVLTTNNSAFTPKLNSWELEWENTRSTASTISFTDKDDQKVNYYRVLSVADNPQLNIATVFLALEDSNIVPLLGTVNLQLRAKLSGDVEDIRLTSTALGPYVLRPGYPAVVTNGPPTRLGVIEARDRDTLMVTYADPTDPTDVRIAQAYIIQLVRGEVRFENSNGTPLDTVAIGDVLYVRVTGETDRDFTPAQDSLEVKLSRANAQTTDMETLRLYEIPSPTNRQIFNTGEFVSRSGIVLTKERSPDNDGRLQVNGGDQIRVDYIDLDDTRDQDFAFVSLDTIPNVNVLLDPNKAFDFFVAPNPFHAKRHNSFRIAVVARTVDMDIQRLEIYNFAGERVRSMPSTALPFRSQIASNNQALSRENAMWWDFKTDDGSQVAAGTYWAKLDVLVTDPTTGRTQKTTALRKFVILR